MNDDGIQRQLLAESKLNCKKALKIAIGVETATKNLCELQGPSSLWLPQGLRDIEKVTVGQAESGNYCYRFGRLDHKSSQCPFMCAKCHYCSKMGHIKRSADSPGSQHIHMMGSLLDSIQ